MAKLKAVIFSGAIAAGLLGVLPLRPASAQIPVTDAAANVSLIAQIKHQVEMLAQFAAQVAQLTNLVSLATVASTVLGDTVSPEMGQLFTALTDAYSRSNSAYASIMRVPANIDSEIALFREPPGGWATLSFPELVRRAERIRRLTADTSAASVASQAATIERRVQIAELAARANGMSARSVSALSAAQATAEQGRVAAMILQNIEKTNADMLTTIALKLETEQGEREITKEMRRQDIDAMRETLAGGAAQMNSSPVEWGR